VASYFDRNRRIVVLGAGGLLGTPLASQLSQLANVELYAFKRGQLDITERPRVRACFADLSPDVVINCAAFTRVDDCEREVELAMLVNGHAPGALSVMAADVGARFVHMSTDYVFDGRKPMAYVENDPTGPDGELSAYGRSKLEGERRVLAAGGQPLIVRTSWVFGENGPNFVATILNLAKSRPELRVVNDQRGCPTYASDLAAAITSLVDVQASGIVHAVNGEPCTWYDFACEIVRRAGLRTPIIPCSSAEFPRPARRPANSVLDTSRFEQLTGRGMRSWRDALRDHLNQAS